MALAAIAAFQDSRLSYSIHDNGMRVNVEAKIPMSNCGTLEDFSRNVLEANSYPVEDATRVQLRNARVNAGFD